MPSGMMIPARNMPPIMGRNGRVVEFGSSSRFPLCQQNLMEEQQNQLEMIQNSAENEMEMNGDEEVDSKSGSDNQEGASGDDQGPNQQPQRKRYHRHTQHQILEMEAFFKECAHPDDKQRKELSQALGLEPLQIKFWFQNKRTQMKNYQERSENSQLRVENEKLLLENMRYKDSIARTSCPTCGGPTTIAEMSLDEHNLTIENAKLREEIDRMSAIATRYAGKPILPYSLPPMAPHSLELGVGNFGRDMVGAGGHFLRPISATNEVEKPMVVDLAVVAMEELYRMAQVGEPLWTMGMDNVTDHLSQEEYFRTFPRRTGQRHIGLKSEASRQTAIVIMNHLNLVEILMNVNQWLNMFCGIVARATTLDVLSTGIAGNYDGALQVMTAEFQISTPLVPTRESVFLRYCKQHAHGIWAVVDVSLDLLGSGPGSRYRRRPSGCVIQEMPSGYSKVIWVEHVDADDRGVHDICKSLVNSSLAFGAKRWVSILERQCQRLANVMALNHPSEVGGMILSQEGRRSLLKLAERMVMSYYSGAGASIAPIWSPVSGGGDEEIRIMSRTCIDNPGRPTGVVLCGTISFWLPVPPARVFDYVREHNTRSEWDILSNVGLVQEIAHIANGRDRANSVSVLRVNSANSSQVNMLIIQETFMESNGYYVIYAPLDAAAMNVIITGDNPDCVAVLPSGFAIFPGPTTHGGGIIEGGGRGGTVLTASFQVLIDPCPTAKIDMGAVATVNNLISCTIQRIKAVFSCNNA